MRFSLGEVGQAGVSIGSRWTSGSLIARFCIWSPLRGLRGSRFLERLAFSDEFGQGVDACLCAKERCELVVLCSFVDYIGIFLVRPAFEHCARASVVLLRMDSRWVLVCFGFGSTRQSFRVQF